MKYEKEYRLYYHDTDAYGVMWHGACIKWFEESRIEFCEKLGLTMKYLDSKGIIFPVVSVDIRYKASGFTNDVLIVETELKEVRAMKLTFSHVIKNKETGHVNILAETSVVATDNNGKLIRHLPEEVQKALEAALSKA